MSQLPLFPPGSYDVYIITTRQPVYVRIQTGSRSSFEAYSVWLLATDFRIQEDLCYATVTLAYVQDRWRPLMPNGPIVIPITNLASFQYRKEGTTEEEEDDS